MTEVIDTTEDSNMQDYSPLWEAANEARYQRQKYLAEIESISNSKIITYISPKGHSMSPQDFVPFMDLFRGIDSADEILLILQTFGGDPNVASKMVNTI